MVWSAVMQEFCNPRHHVVKNGKRYEGWTAIISAVNTTDAMTATIEEIPYPLLHAICDRITHEVEGINRVFMDITPKPIGTIEFE